jgi:AraC-like DNA-binding protein
VRAPPIDPHDVRSLSATYRDGHHVGRHNHDWAQVIYAQRGMLRVMADQQVWLVPPTRALWIPPGLEHEFIVKGEVGLRTLYVAPARSAAVARGVETFEISPLLRELILHILSLQILDPSIAAQDRLAGVLVDLINDAPPIDLVLPLPGDARARRLADHFQAQPCDRRGLAQLATSAGASLRTLQRLFHTETGITIDAWRQKARLIAATVPLAEGAKITAAALDCGYDSPSAFTAAFKRQFRMTPSQFAGAR